ncbi:hypothetical protein [Streptomyces sp. DSM 40750]|uniref:hypothetical protein n=1 Tax=Streptomyces sp. DSM 40750 TaxID=2801030 RepID=UPI00214CBCEA|nr:hypothetical protein [Streptomyces sp. DSM 40750]UUU22277.1 hypothetical protein JIX55_19265 [Streptomyces sp. DSM 40750]
MALVLAVLTTAGLLTLAGPVGSAEAAAPGCGGRKVRTLTFDAGTVKVYRKGRRYVCAVLVPEKAGKAKPRRAFVKMRPRGGEWAKNKTHPTGPVIVHAGKRRVWIHAQVGSEKYDSGWILH